MHQTGGDSAETLPLFLLLLSERPPDGKRGRNRVEKDDTGRFRKLNCGGGRRDCGHFFIRCRAGIKTP